ncbi:MAG TPA: hypothetical protein VE866_06045 [Candidatus Binatia bacterium]|nr:hypothetical protein [Candidatus Binatia bacterium]
MRGKSELLRSAGPAQPSRQGAGKTNNKPNKHRGRPVFDPREAARLLLSGKMPNDAIVSGNLSLTGCSPIFAPGMQFKGNLSVLECFPKLAPGMKVDGFADFFSSPLKSLPSNFTAKLGLGLMSTGISKLPDDLKVGGNIDVDRNAPKSIVEQAKALSNNPEAKKTASANGGKRATNSKARRK